MRKVAGRVRRRLRLLANAGSQRHCPICGRSFRSFAGAGRPLYTRSGEDIEVRLRLAPAARWVAEYYDTDRVVEVDDGSVEVTLPTKRLGWVARLALRLGDSVEVLGPPELSDEVRGTAAAALARYAEKPR